MPRRSRKPQARRDPKSSSALLALQREVQGRFISSGGRPADPDATIRRLVPVSPRTWKELTSQAALLSKVGARISPGQLAAVLLERGLSDLLPSSQQSDRLRDLEKAR